MRDDSDFKRLTASVDCGHLASHDRVAAMLALEDLRGCWERYFGRGSFDTAPQDPYGPADVRILIGSGSSHAEIAAAENEGQIEKIAPDPESFALDVVGREGGRLAVLRAVDRLGLQYAVYGFAERFLGIRFAHPFFDLGPPIPPLQRISPVTQTNGHRS